MKFYCNFQRPGRLIHCFTIRKGDKLIIPKHSRSGRLLKDERGRKIK